MTQRKPSLSFLESTTRSDGRSNIVVEGEGEIRLGSDLVYWSKAAKFLLELIARQRFLPYFSKENSHYQSTWLLAPTDEDDSTRLDHLASEMPQNMEGVFQSRKTALFPTKSDLKTDCSCPDDANPCKHIVAVYYQRFFVSGVWSEK